MNDTHFDAPAGDRIAILNEMIDGAAFRHRDSDPLRLHIELVEQEQIGFVDRSRGASELLQVADRTHMIDVRMRAHDLLHCQAMLLEPRENFRGIVTGVDHDLVTYQTAVRDQWRAAGASQELIDQAAGAMHSATQLYPGLLALAGIAGVRLAWTWYHRVAVRPLGKPPAPFRAFGFSDHLVWGWVVALGLALLPVPQPWSLLGANLLLVLGVLYAARGVAVFVAQTGRIPAPLAGVLALVATFLLPFVVAGLTLLGLADTWLDFRRRLSTPATGGDR